MARVSPAPAYDRFLERLAARMNDRLGRGLERHPDLAAMYRAMMLGRKGGLTPAQKLLFMHGGVMHLFAINGLHIGMVAIALHALLALARCPRPLAALLVLAILWLDVETTGASPSAVRAFLMVAVLETARAFRCPCNPVAALAASALPVLLANPMDFFSASFRMSYAVVGGILTFGLPFSARMGRRFAPYRYLPEVSWTRRQRALAWVWNHLLQASGIGIAAALVGAVTGIEYFGVVTPIGLVGNLVLVPLASLVIVSGCLCLVAPDIGLHPPLLFNHAAGLLLAVIEGLLRLSSRVPLAWIPAHYRSGWIGPTALASLMAAFLWGYANGWKRERGGWLPPVAIVALALALGVRFG
jgi:competence protein ComEC